MNEHNNNVLMALEMIDGLIICINPLKYKANHEKMRTISPALRKQLIETLRPQEGYHQAMLAGKHIPYIHLSEKLLAKRRHYDSVSFLKRRQKKLTIKNQPNLLLIP